MFLAFVAIFLACCLHLLPFSLHVACRTPSLFAASCCASSCFLRQVFLVHCWLLCMLLAMYAVLHVPTCNFLPMYSLLCTGPPSACKCMFLPIYSCLLDILAPTVAKKLYATTHTAASFFWGFLGRAFFFGDISFPSIREKCSSCALRASSLAFRSWCQIRAFSLSDGELGRTADSCAFLGIFVPI